MKQKPHLRSLSALKAYGLRLRVWMSVALEVRGCSQKDKSILRRASLRAPFTSLHALDQWRDPMVDEDCRVVTKLGIFRVRANSDDLYLTLPGREATIVRTMKEMLHPGDWFVDAGANIGAYTVFGASLGAKVIAVEMMPQTAAILRRHCRDNHCQHVKIVEAALADVAGKTVRATFEPGKFGSASIAVERTGQTAEVSTTTLCAVLEHVPKVRLMKMDLEGAEFEAIRGAPLGKINAIIFEDWGDQKLSTFFAEADFDVRRLDGTNSLAVRRGT